MADIDDPYIHYDTNHPSIPTRWLVRYDPAFATADLWPFIQRGLETWAGFIDMTWERVYGGENILFDWDPALSSGAVAVTTDLFPHAHISANPNIGQYTVTTPQAWRVMAHEIGHVMALIHKFPNPDGGNLLMSAGLGSGLTQGEAAALRVLYGPPTGNPPFPAQVALTTSPQTFMYRGPKLWGKNMAAAFHPSVTQVVNAGGYGTKWLGAGGAYTNDVPWIRGSGPSPVTVSFQVAASADDGAWAINGAGFNNNQPSALVGNNAGELEAAWVRFLNVNIPPFSTIASASLEIVNGGVQVTDVAAVRITADAADNATAPTSNANANGRSVTTAYADWTIPHLTLNASYSSPDISTVIQEKVSGGTWVSGDALVLYAKDNGSDVSCLRTIATYDDTPSRAAILHVTYMGPGLDTVGYGAAGAGWGDRWQYNGQADENDFLSYGDTITVYSTDEYAYPHVPNPDYGPSGSASTTNGPSGSARITK